MISNSKIVNPCKKAWSYLGCLSRFVKGFKKSKYFNDQSKKEVFISDLRTIMNTIIMRVLVPMASVLRIKAPERKLKSYYIAKIFEILTGYLEGTDSTLDKFLMETLNIEYFLDRTLINLFRKLGALYELHAEYIIAAEKFPTERSNKLGVPEKLSLPALQDIGSTIQPKKCDFCKEDARTIKKETNPAGIALCETHTRNFESLMFTLRAYKCKPAGLEIIQAKDVKPGDVIFHCSHSNFVPVEKVKIFGSKNSSVQLTLTLKHIYEDERLVARAPQPSS